MLAARGTAQPAASPPPTPPTPPPHPPLQGVRRTVGDQVRRRISEGRREGAGGTRVCDRLWTFPGTQVGRGIELHRESPSEATLLQGKSGVLKHTARLVRRLWIVTAPCEQVRRALCHAERLSDSPAGSHRGGRASPAMSRLERRGPPHAAHQLLQRVPGQPGVGRALLQAVRGGEGSRSRSRSLARRLPAADSVPVQRERPEAAAHLAGGPLGQQLRLPV